jgi:CRISPR/Cas system-associated exonuclease Cas4 (RecB family)
MSAYSYSRLRTYADCPAALKLQLDKAPSERPAPMIIGGLAHEAIENYIRRCHRQKTPSDAALIDEIVPSLSGIGPYESDVRGLLDRFAATFQVFLSEPDLETKRAFTRSWKPTTWFGKGVRFRAVMDLIEVTDTGDEVVITDWKTGWKIPPRSELEEDLQLRIYAYIASLLYPKAEQFTCRLWYVRPAFAYEFELFREDLGDVREDLERRMAAIDAEQKWTATPGDHCQGCLYRRSCDHYRRAGLGEIPDNTAELAAEYFLVKARQKDLESALKARVEAEGPLEQSGGKVLGFQAQEQVKIVETKAAVKELDRLGVPGPAIWDSLSLSKTAVEKLLRKAEQREHIPAFLEDHGQVSIRSVFKSHKPKGGAA